MWSGRYILVKCTDKAHNISRRTLMFQSCQLLDWRSHTNLCRTTLPCLKKKRKKKVAVHTTMQLHSFCFCSSSSQMREGGANVAFCQKCMFREGMSLDSDRISMWKSVKHVSNRCKYMVWSRSSWTKTVICWFASIHQHNGFEIKQSRFA